MTHLSYRALQLCSWHNGMYTVQALPLMVRLDRSNPWVRFWFDNERDSVAHSEVLDNMLRCLEYRDILRYLIRLR